MTLETGTVKTAKNQENPVLYRADPFLTFDPLYEEGRCVSFAVGTVSTRDRETEEALRARALESRKKETAAR